MSYNNFQDRPDIQRIEEIAKKSHIEVNSEDVQLYLQFQLTYREIENEYNNLLSRFDLSESRFAILMFLFYAENRQLLPSEIANKLAVTRPTISKLLKSMRQKGLVTSHPSTKDKRVNYIKITASGEQLLHEFLPYNYQATTTLFVGFTPAEKQTFLKLLQKLLANKQNVRKIGDGTNGNQ